jgi:hypothetical protein
MLVRRRLGGRGNLLLTSKPVALILTRKYWKVRTADPGNLSSTLLLMRAGREEFASNGCSAKPSRAPGRLFIKEERPKSIVVFDSWSSKYRTPTWRN